MNIGNTPAFPRQCDPSANGESGMTLHQYYAGLAMQGLIVAQGNLDMSTVFSKVAEEMSIGESELTARRAVECADALIAELERI